MQWRTLRGLRLKFPAQLPAEKLIVSAVGRARYVMKLLVCLLTCCGLAAGSLVTPPWMSATPGLRDPVTQCPDYPFPTVSENTLLEQLQPFLDKLAANISKLLQQTESPGGVAIGLVYNQSLIWMKGFGQTSKQGESYIN